MSTRGTTLGSWLHGRQGKSFLQRLKPSMLVREAWLILSQQQHPILCLLLVHLLLQLLLHLLLHLQGVVMPQLESQEGLNQLRCRLVTRHHHMPKASANRSRPSTCLKAS